MRRADRAIAWPLAIAGALASTIGWALWFARPTELGLAIALQLVAAALAARSIKRERELAWALALTVPGFGPIAGALAATTRGRGGFALVREPPHPVATVDGRAIARGLSGALPRCDAVACTDADVRRATLGTLTQHATSDDIAALRWARAHGTGEIALDAALAFEQLSERLEHEVPRERADYDAAARAFRAIATGIVIGLVDAASTARLVRAARTHHAAAIAADAERARELLADRARIELATGHPDVALAVLRPALGVDEELTALYKQAAYAARRFELAPEVARARG